MNGSEKHSFQACTHIGKLTKKALQSLMLLNYQPNCSICKQKLKCNKFNSNQISNNQQNEANICLHCGALCCNNIICITSHQPQLHLFWAKIKITSQILPSLIQSENMKQHMQTSQSQIFCKLCGSINQQAKNYEKMQVKDENGSKIIRFYQFVRNCIKILGQIVYCKIQQYQQLNLVDCFDVFGLHNLGNTCFLNSVLQILYHTTLFTQFYVKEQPKMHLISKQNYKRRQIQQFYDKILQKQQSNSWHIVQDKKSKAKQKLDKNNNFETFLQQGLIKDIKFNKSYTNFIRNIYKNQKQQKSKFIYDPTQLIDMLGNFDKKYSLNQEQDAQQLLILLIDILSQGQMISIAGKQGDKRKRYDQIQNLLGRQKLTPTQQIFGSYLASHVVCLGCKKQNWTIDFTYHLLISLSQPKQTPESQAGNNNTPIKNLNYYKQMYLPENSTHKSLNIIQNLFKPQRLTNKQNYYFCEKCSALSAIKQFYLLDPPEIMIISLKRFQNHKKSKLAKFVHFSQFIDIRSFTLTQKNTQNQIPSYKYELYGIIIHKGDNITSGHYICYAKKVYKIEDKQHRFWYQFSDQKYRKVTQKQVMRQEAYILFYSRTSQIK